MSVEDFARYMASKNVVKPAGERKYPCPCCGYRTLAERGMYAICPVCFWEDDGQDEHDADVVRGGPNSDLSLTNARLNFKEFGACDLRCVGSVRKPLADEIA